MEGFFIDRMEQNEWITAKYLNEKDFMDVVGQRLMEEVYEQIKKRVLACLSSHWGAGGTAGTKPSLISC
jgi:hypothetical protein